MSFNALNSPAELLSLRQSSVKRSCHKGRRGPLDSGPAAPGPWRCISHRAQSKTPGARLQLKHKKKEIRLTRDITSQWTWLYCPHICIGNPKTLLFNFAFASATKICKVTVNSLTVGGQANTS